MLESTKNDSLSSSGRKKKLSTVISVLFEVKRQGGVQRYLIFFFAFICEKNWKFFDLKTCHNLPHLLFNPVLKLFQQLSSWSFRGYLFIYLLCSFAKNIKKKPENGKFKLERNLIKASLEDFVFLSSSSLNRIIEILNCILVAQTNIVSFLSWS